MDSQEPVEPARDKHERAAGKEGGTEPSPASPGETGRRSIRNLDLGLLLIAIFKLTKGVLLLVAGIGALSLIHKDVAQVAMKWADVFRVDPNNRHFHKLLEKLGLVNARRLEEISAGTFFYSALLLTEGTGLLLRKRWAEYFTVIVTGSFIPMEVYELIRRLTFTRVFLIGLNIAIVWYLVDRLLRHRREEAGRGVSNRGGPAGNAGGAS